MKISYSILTHNEDETLLKLLEFLVKHKDDEDEIVILDDYSDNPKTIEILDVMTSMHEMTFEQRHLLKDYAGQKNYLKNMCTGDYIFNLDADELPLYVTPKLEYDYFVRKDLNWKLEAATPEVSNFIQEEFDILIDMTITDDEVLRFVIRESKARFKVGGSGCKVANDLDFTIKLLLFEDL